MRVGFMLDGNLQALKMLSRTSQVEEGGVLLLGFDALGEVSYEKELKGESMYFEEIALLSKRLKNVVICGCITNTRGLKRKSAIVAENGKILGVSDMLNTWDGEKNCGAALRVYETKMGKIGVVVAEDLYFPETVKALSLCGANYIVCPFERLTSSIQSVLLRSYAFCYGTPIFLCARGYGIIANGAGDIVFSTPQSPAYFDFVNATEYHVLQTRRRFCRPPV